MEKNKLTKTKQLYWGEEFEEYMKDFKDMIKEDKEIIASIPENQKNKVLKLGLFSHAIKELIKEYVDANKSSFIKRKKAENGETDNK